MQKTLRGGGGLSWIVEKAKLAEIRLPDKQFLIQFKAHNDSE